MTEPLQVDQLGLPAEVTKELERLSSSYEFEKLSEKGENGYLLIGRNTVLNRRVATKFYYWADEQRKHIEPSALARIRSPSIIEVLEAAIVGDEWAMFVTPFCQHGDLDTFRSRHRFDLREALRFAEQLLSGVACLHEARYVHRDLKPENILVSDEGGPLIADFGSVRLIPEEDEAVSGSGHAVLYRPPESFSSGVYDRRGDVYQVGIVLYQILGGRLSYSYIDYLSDDEKRDYAEVEKDYERSKIVDPVLFTL